MKYLYLKNLKNFNLLRLNDTLFNNNFSFFLFYINYDEINFYRDFININKFIFKIYFNFAFKSFKLANYWKLWGNNYYTCFFFNNDIYFQLDFILKNKKFIDDYVYNGTFVNIDQLNNDTLLFIDDFFFFIDIKFYFVLLYIYYYIYIFLNNFLFYFLKIKI